MADPIKLAGIEVRTSRHLDEFAIFLLRDDRPRASSDVLGVCWPRMGPMFVAGVLVLPYMKWLEHWRAAWWLDA